MNKPKHDAHTESGIFYLATLCSFLFWIGSTAYGLDHLAITLIASLFSAIAGYSLKKWMNKFN